MARLGCDLPAGLSPLARGNLEIQYSKGVGMGPIPARAGEPWLSLN